MSHTSDGYKHKFASRGYLEYNAGECPGRHYVQEKRPGDRCKDVFVSYF